MFEQFSIKQSKINYMNLFFNPHGHFKNVLMTTTMYIYTHVCTYIRRYKVLKIHCDI